MDRRAITDLIEVFFRAGVDPLMGPTWMPVLVEAIQEAEDRTGVGAVVVAVFFAWRGRS